MEKKELDDLMKRLDILVILELAKYGFNIKEIAKILSLSDNTISKMFLNKYKKISKLKANPND